MYFRLNPESLLTTGECGSIICDAFTNKIYHLNEYETKLIVHAENNNIVDENEELYHTLKNKCLGKFYENIPYIIKIRTDSFLQRNIEFSFKKFYLELTDICHESCDYCAFKNYFRSLGCIGCNSFNETGEYLSSEEFINIIDVISNLGCDELYITGGDLSLNMELSTQIINYAKDKIKDVFIILSYKHNYQKFLKIINHNIHMILQIDLDQINSNLLSSNNITYLVIVPEDKERLFHEKTNKFNELTFLPDFLTKDNNVNPNLNKNYHFDLISFYHNLEFHPCLGKTLFISSKGNIFPCPMFRTCKIANIKNKEFMSVLREIKNIILMIWKNNLDYINNCKDCEFRYICSDCRALEEKLSDSPNNKLLCEFNK